MRIPMLKVPRIMENAKHAAPAEALLVICWMRWSYAVINLIQQCDEDCPTDCALETSDQHMIVPKLACLRQQIPS